jgi:hypothetical protein
MDYNRVQSYIKSHVLPKLDSLPDDVASVKQAFDAWKADWTQARAVKLDNLDATISSRASSQAVDGVRGGVDTLKTTLTDVQTKVNAVEGSVARLHDGLASVQDATDFPRNYVMNSGQFAGKISGSGYIVAIQVITGGITIDNRPTVESNVSSVYWFCKPYATYASSSHGSVNVFGRRDYESNVSINMSASASYIHPDDFNGDKMNALDGRTFYSLQPIRFEKHIIVTNACLLYTLDPT